MAVTLPGRDRERLIRTLAASAIRRPLSPADLRFPDATENSFARTLAPSTHLQTHPLRPALPPRDRKRLAHPLAASAIRRPLSLADLRFLCATENGSSAPLPRPPFAGPSPPPTCASPCDRKRLALPLVASAHSQAPLPRRPALPRATENGFALPLAASAHSPAPLSRRPALPRATENGSSALLPRLPIADPLPVDRRFPVRPRTDCPHSCRVRHSQALSPADLRFLRATANVPARGFSQAPGDGLRPSGMALAVPPRHVGQKMFKFYNSLKIALSPVDSGMRACYNVPSGYPVVCATPVLLPTDSKKDSGSVSVDVMPPISDRPGKAANGRRSPPCLSGG